MKSLKIVIDGRMFGQSGIGRYIRNLVSNLQLIDQDNQYFILLGRKDFNSLSLQNNFHKVLADFHWYGLSEQFRLLGILDALKPNLTHFPHFNIPLLFKGRYVVTIHDLIHQHFSMERATTHGRVIYKIKQTGYKFIFRNALSKSAKVLTPSQFVKKQLVKEWKVNKEKIVVTPEAVDEGMLALIESISDQDMKEVLEQLNIKVPYIFYVGNAHPHKNVEGLIKAFRKLKEKFTNLSLVLSGSDHYFWQKIKKEFPHQDIIYTGFISDEQLVVLYRNAEVFIIPSFEEGFGIPMLEAMASGCPVVASGVGSLPEVGKNAAVYFDPHSKEDMAEKISEVLDSKEIRKQLIEKGIKRYKEFSWKKLAQQTLEVYLTA